MSASKGSQAKENPEDFESHCGIGDCVPSSLQWLKNMLSFVLFYGVTSLATQSLNVYITSQITAIEKQFHLGSTTTGLILSCNEIGFLCTVLFISHFGRDGHIPRILSVTCMIFGLSGILSGICYFIDPYYLPKLGTENTGNDSLQNGVYLAPLCNNIKETWSNNNCQDKDVPGTTTNGTLAVWVLGLSMVLQGIGKSPRSSLSIAYIDNNNPVKTKTGMYLGISMTLTMMGPAIAMGLGGLFRRFPADLQETLLTPTHPKWIGAWWLGFVIFGVLGILLAIPLLFFPKRIIPATKDLADVDVTISDKVKDLPRSMLRIVKKPVYTLTLCGMLCLLLSASGRFTFASKYVEKQFTIPAYKTNIMLGVVSILGMSVGTLLGGFLTSHLKLTRLGCMRLAIACVTSSILCSVLELFLGCETPDIVGFKADGSTGYSNIGCNCSQTEYFPVCGDGKDVYFSPCFAGCKNQTLMLYEGCSETFSGRAVAGLCETDCPFLYVYVCLTLLHTLVMTMAVMPLTVIEIRTVSDKDKAAAFALFSFLSSLIAFLPGPILYGIVIDRTCLIWEYTCGVKGACSQYDLKDLRYYFKLTDGSGKVVSATFFILSFMVLRKCTDKNEIANLEMKQSEYKMDNGKAAEKTEDSKL